MLELDLNSLLVWLATGGAVIAISWAVDNWGWFADMEPAKKQLVMYALSGLLACAALAITTYVPAEYLAMVAPFAKVLIMTFAAIYLSEQYHAKAKLTGPKG